MLIGELAFATGTSAKTLRFYEAEGLLADPGRTTGGYRDYPQGAVDRVRFVRAAQAAGLSLAQIRQVLAVRDAGQPPCDHVAALVEERLADVEVRLHALVQARGQLQALRERVRGLDPRACEPSQVCSAVPADR